jgi:hypothetical protein
MEDRRDGQNQAGVNRRAFVGALGAAAAVIYPQILNGHTAALELWNNYVNGTPCS